LTNKEKKIIFPDQLIMVVVEPIIVTPLRTKLLSSLLYVSKTKKKREHNHQCTDSCVPSEKKRVFYFCEL